jgi:uncharacterized membrane protein
MLAANHAAILTKRSTMTITIFHNPLSPRSSGWARAARWTWLGLIVLQPTWLAILPPPAGPGNRALAALATLPLLLPLGGVWQGSLRTMSWAGYLAMLYLVIGVVEAWANPPQRPAALLQVVLVAAFVGSALGFSRAAGRSVGGRAR